MFGVQYLNNMQLHNDKGLIVDFALEDARVLHKREMRLQKQKKINEERKREQKQENKGEGKGP